MGDNTKRYIALGLAVVGVGLGLLYFSFGTVTPCGIVKQQMRTAYLQHIQGEAASATSDMERAGLGLGAALGNSMIDGMVDSLSPMQCTRIAWNMVVKGEKPFQDRMPLTPSTTTTQSNAPSGSGGERAEVGAGDDSTEEDPWFMRTEESPMDNSENVYLSVKSNEETAGQFGMDRTPRLWLRCRENTTAAIISWDQYLGIDDPKFTYRIGEADPVTTEWSASTDNDSIGLWRGRESIPWIKQLFGHEKLVARVESSTVGQVTVTFPIAGVEEKIQPLREACNW